MKRGDAVTVASAGDYGKPRPAVCVFRSKSISYSSPSRSPIPVQADHPIRSKPITVSGGKPISFAA
jgi:hypothetical protein